MRTWLEKSYLLNWWGAALLSTLLILSSESGLCQEHSIVALGKGTVEVEADVAYLIASIQTQGPLAENACDENNRVLKQVMDKLQGAGISPQNIVVSKLLIQPGGWPPGPIPSTGIRAFRRILVTVENFTEERLAKLVDVVMSGGANASPSAEYRGPGLDSIVLYSVKDQEKYKQEALIKAVAAARAQAEVLAKSLSISLPIKMTVRHSISESGAERGVRLMGVMDMSVLPEKLRDTVLSLDGDKVRISASVTITYGESEKTP